ncbi:hypothetical protein REC12_01765 [Desulfosporosinus sp. PR]|uniref:hypothetical protein n=1 Tax=Candidatus Desulfosporosinus nitrosoreducens TaxID=3401928 RepID=UPI0027FC1E1E|nr:hypothetical protein [Desulfosporosinus sp. PR]MDQ7092318.1 hypothetical protein [Desulfosporosinus sp. PR]
MKETQTASDKIIKFRMAASIYAVKELICVLEKQLKKEEVFGIAIVREGEEANIPEARKLFSNWLKDNKPLMKKYCSGVALVTASESMQKLYKSLARIMIAKTYGCPGRLFTKDEDAAAWLLNQRKEIFDPEKNKH